MSEKQTIEQRIDRLERDMATALRLMQTLKAEIERLGANSENLFAAHNRLVEKLTRSTSTPAGPLLN